MEKFDFKILFKKALPHICAIAIMYLLTLVYFSPVCLDNKDLPQGDMISVNGMTKSVKDYQEVSGEYSGWTNSMFSGMPTETLYGKPGFNINSKFADILRFGFPYSTAGMFFCYLIGFYIFAVCLGANAWLALLAAIAYALASYNLIVIEAGHITKAYAMAFVAPMIGGVILAYRKKYLPGFIITLIFLGVLISRSHIQIDYYATIMVGCIVAAYFVYYLINHIKKTEKFSAFWKASGLLAIAAILAILPNMANLYSSYEYSKDTMRGGSELTITPNHIESANKPNEGGLEIDYAYAWSYGRMETLTLLVPNMYGGGHVVLDKKDPLIQDLRQSGYGSTGLPTYWGDQPFTSGPVYAGAIVCFLFVLGLFIVKGPEKWWIIAACVISIILAWGRHLMPVNEWLFHNLPFYNKFRAPSMALIIAGIAMPTMVIFTLKNIISPKIDKNKVWKYTKISFYISGGLCLIFAIFAKSMFSFTGGGDASFIQQLTSAGFPQSNVDGIMSILIDYRQSMLVKDALRSLLFISLAFGFIWLFLKNKIKKENLFVLALSALIIVDMWMVDKRYLNDTNFQPIRNVKNAIQKTKADEIILEDNDINYRVLNLTINTFNDATTSYFHKSIGGYSPAKLRRYQDMIDFYIQNDMQKLYANIAQANGDMTKVNPNNFKVLNMLNMKYVIIPTSSGTIPLENPYRYGNAWFVDSVKLVANPNEEILAIANTNVKNTAIIDKRYEKFVSGKTFLTDSTSSIENVLCNPNKLQYKTSTSTEKLVVFSEIFYDRGGWDVKIDGQPASHFRANYILRAMVIPAGEHLIEFSYIPHARLLGCKISAIASWTVIIILLLSVGFLYIKKNKNIDNKMNK